MYMLYIIFAHKKHAVIALPQKQDQIMDFL